MAFSRFFLRPMAGTAVRRALEKGIDLSPLFPQIAALCVRVTMNCIFCDIIHGKAPAKTVFENDRVIIFRDHRPQAPIHLLICPKTHYATFLETPAEEFNYLLKVCLVWPKP